MQPHAAEEARLSRPSSWPIAQPAAPQDATTLLSPPTSLEDASLPVSGQAAQQQQRPRGDTSVDSFLAFVDSFPLCDGHLLLDGDTDSDADASEQSRGQQREVNRKKEHNKYLQKARVSDLQTQATALRRRLAALETLSNADTSSPLDMSDYEGATERETKEWKLLRLSQEKEKLQAENAQLHEHFHRSMAFSGKLRGMLNAEHKLYLTNSSYFVVLKPLTPPDCQSELKHSMENITKSYAAAEKLDRCREIYGWDEKRLTHRAEFHNWKRKTLRFKSARFVFGQTWEVLTNPFRTEKLFSSAMGARCRLVQRVDDDNLLFCYDYASSSMLAQKSEAPEVTTMALVSRVSTSTGHFIITRGLSHGLVEVQDLLKSKLADETRPVWLKTFTWIHFEQVGKNCDITIGGVLPALRSNSYFWLVGCVQLALRWEMMVLGPRFKLS